MDEIIKQVPLSLPVPAVAMSIRQATRNDIGFMDGMQKLHRKALGFFPLAQMEGYIDAGNVLIAFDPTTDDRLGFVASKDRYLKRDELGAVFQLCIVPNAMRKLVGANLLRGVFERSSYGCKLYCCWCAQDLPANKFWEAMGFAPIAYRAGSEKKSRVHIFWQKRIRANDSTTPYWFPAKTEGGAIREDRIILPIPPGMKWTDALPVLIPESKDSATGEKPTRRKTSAKPIKPIRPKMRYGPPDMDVPTAPVAPEPKTEPVQQRAPREKRKCDPALIAKARELRDRWMDHVSANQIESLNAKYDVARTLERTPIPGDELKRLAA